MTSGVNLVPMAQRLARTRVRRRVVWSGVGLALAILVASAWAIEVSAARGLHRLSDRVMATEHRRAEIQRRLALAETQRQDALDALQTLAAARRPQPWARRWVTLTAAAPEGVFLTALTLSEVKSDPRSGGRETGRDAGRTGLTGRDAGRIGRETGRDAGRTQAAPEAPRGAREVLLRGYALDHGALIQLLHTLQNLPGWHQVELIRATSEPFRAGHAVAFELACATQEDDP